MSSAGPDVDLLAAIESGQAPRRILEFAARGFVPLPPGELVRAIGTILAAGDPELVPLAEETFKTFDDAAFSSAVSSDGVRTEQLDVLARRVTDPKVLEPLIRHRVVGDETLAWLAERIGPDLQDVLVTNQARLLAAPVIVERLFENPHLSTDIRRRADEFLEEFFLKKEREEMEKEEAAAEVAKEAAPKTEEERKKEGEAAAELEAELSEEEKKGIYARLQNLTVVQRIRMAYRGNKEERLFLIRDPNRLVTAAVLKSPKTRDADAETIANMKSVSEDVLRTIAMRRDWMKKYSILVAIVKNPRSPIDITIPLVPKLLQKDQKTLAGDRNVPEGIRATARRVVARREA